MAECEDLDSLLFAWLSEGDERRAERRFDDYFRAAFPTLCRYVRSLRTDPASAQDIAQQALIKLFNHLGTGRRAADEQVRNAVSLLRPLDFGPVHVRAVNAWRQQVAAFRDAAVGFRIDREFHKEATTWKELRTEINGQIDPLTRQGTHFLDEVRARVVSAWEALITYRHVRVDGEIADGPPDSVEQVRLFVSKFLRYAEGRQDSDVEDAIGCAGAVGFVTRTNCVCDHLPTLAIPSSGLLYTIAKRQFIDRERSNQIRRFDYAADTTDGDASVLDQLDFGVDRAEPLEPRPLSTPVARSDLTGTEERDVELQDRYAAFLEFLRGPLTRAEGAFSAASCKGKAEAESTRVESLKAKYDRLMAILAALRESPQPTEDEIAWRLNLTRNQVKYAVERIRSEFNYFFPDLARDARGRRKSQGLE
jgi:DNA-directed RNA polymerase specialized sigma24 family protein